MEGSRILILLSVILLLCSFSPLSLYPLAFIALVPLIGELYLLNESKAPLKTYICKGFLFGALYMGGMHIWLLNLHVWSQWSSILLLVGAYTLLLGLYYAGLWICFYYFRHSLWITPFLWVCWEWIRSLSSIGNPTGILGYSQARHLLFIQQASFGGVFWISFLCVLINVILFKILQNHLSRHSNTYIVTFLAFIIVGSYSFGLWNLYRPLPPHTTTRIGFVQASHPQKDKLVRSNASKLRHDYIKISQAALKQDDISILIWPETISTEYNLENKPFIKRLTLLAHAHDTAFLFGTPTYENKKYYNSMALVSKDGIHAPIYHKQRLMPFGEYWPAKSLFRGLKLGHIIPRNEYSPGDSSTIKLGSITIGCSVCLESLYPWFSRKAAQHNADFFTVIANNAWFLDSSGAYKHFHMSIFRAIENNRYLIQSANTGISAIISNKGKIEVETQLNERTWNSADITIGLPMSLYTRFGDWIIGISMIIIAVVLKRKGIGIE